MAGDAEDGGAVHAFMYGMTPYYAVATGFSDSTENGDYSLFVDAAKPVGCIPQDPRAPVVTTSEEEMGSESMGSQDENGTNDANTSTDDDNGTNDENTADDDNSDSSADDSSVNNSVFVSPSLIDYLNNHLPTNLKENKITMDYSIIILIQSPNLTNPNRIQYYIKFDNLRCLVEGEDAKKKNE
mgnify:CR=1 FL=1